MRIAGEEAVHLARMYLGMGKYGVPMNPVAWDGYAHEREQVMARLNIPGGHLHGACNLALYPVKTFVHFALRYCHSDRYHLPLLLVRLAIADQKAQTGLDGSSQDMA